MRSCYPHQCYPRKVSFYRSLLSVWWMVSLWKIFFKDDQSLLCTCACFSFNPNLTSKNFPQVPKKSLQLSKLEESITKSEMPLLLETIFGK